MALSAANLLTLNPYTSGYGINISNNEISNTLSTSDALSIYVDKAATGDGTGVDWTNAYTTIQSAVNSLPPIVNNAVTIYVRKGATDYDESLIIKNLIVNSSITLRGEYYWYGTNASDKTGKFDISASDPEYANRANISAGDYVLLTKWTTTIEGSAVVESFVDTVASFTGTEVTLTTNTGKALTTAWTYTIVKTILTSSVSAGNTLLVDSINNVTVSGMYISQGNTGYSLKFNITHNCTASTCYLPNGALIFAHSHATFYRCYFARSSCVTTSDMSKSLFYYCVFQASGSGSALSLSNSSNTYVRYCHIRTGSPTGISATSGSYCSGTVLNEASTPKSPASSSDWSHISTS
jgi:hypothetical protein